jgi:hypothetical protein
MAPSAAAMATTTVHDDLQGPRLQAINGSKDGTDCYLFGLSWMFWVLCVPGVCGHGCPEGFCPSLSAFGGGLTLGKWMALVGMVGSIGSVKVEKEKND